MRLRRLFDERPGRLAILLLLLLTLLFFGRVLWPAAGQALAGLDIHALFIPWLTSARLAIYSGRLPLWDPYHFAGYPFLSNPQVGFFYPPMWLAILLPLNAGISWYVVLHVWLAGLGMLLFVRFMGGTWLAAVLAAVTFSFSGFVTARIWAGHIGLLATDAWLPWLLLALAWSVRQKTIPAAVLAGLPFGLAILAGHTTSLLYVGLASFAFACYLLVTTRPRTIVIRQAVIGVLVGLALSSVQLSPLLQFSAVSSRAAAPSFEFATAYSLPPAHLITLLIPDFFGEPVRAGYWSVPNFEELTYYAGVLSILTLLLALRRPTSLTWFYLALIVLGLLLALGSYGFLYRLFYDLLPPFRLVRAPGRAAFLFVFAASALLGHTLSTWQRATQEERRQLGRFMRGTLLVSGLAGILALAATGAVFTALHPVGHSGRLWHQLGGWSVALILMLAGGLLLWRYLAHGAPATRSHLILGAGLILLVIIDLWHFGYKLVRLEPVMQPTLWLDARQIIGETEARVLPWGISIFAQNGAGQVGLHSVFGYNALELAAGQELAASVPDPRSTAYDILGAGYVVSEVPLEGYGDGERPLELVGNTASVWVYRRSRVFPLARLVYQVEVIGNNGRAIARVHEPDFDPASTLILPQPPPCTPDSEQWSVVSGQWSVAGGQQPTGSARILRSEPGYWLIETDSVAPALLILSETAYPGWQVTIDGQAAEPLTAYTAVRAVCVPAGKRQVEWRFAPVIYWLGALFTLPALLLVGWAGFTTWRGRKTPGNLRQAPNVPGRAERLRGH